jgi:hypothetical protein
MKYRNLRIAWSVFWAIACLTVTATWVRSYWWSDEIRYRPATADGFRIWSDEGALRCERFPNALTYQGRRLPFGWSHKKYWNAHFQSLSDVKNVGIWRKAFRGFSSPRYSTLLPYWAIVFPTAVCIVAPKLVWRFSLRIILIAVTLIAGLLGLAVAFR